MLPSTLLCPKSSHCYFLFLSDYKAHRIAKTAVYHTFLFFFFLLGPASPKVSFITSWHWFGQTQDRPNSFNKWDHNRLAKLQCKKKWSLVSLLLLHNTHQFGYRAMLGNFFCITSLVFTFPQARIQLKTLSLGGACDFQMKEYGWKSDISSLIQGFLKAGLQENSFELSSNQTLLSSIVAGRMAESSTWITSEIWNDSLSFKFLKNFRFQEKTPSLIYTSSPLTSAIKAFFESENFNLTQTVWK